MDTSCKKTHRELGGAQKRHLAWEDRKGTQMGSGTKQPKQNACAELGRVLTESFEHLCSVVI